jgi:hypothetical protein
LGSIIALTARSLCELGTVDDRASHDNCEAGSRSMENKVATIVSSISLIVKVAIPHDFVQGLSLAVRAPNGFLLKATPAMEASAGSCSRTFIQPSRLIF